MIKANAGITKIFRNKLAKTIALLAAMFLSGCAGNMASTFTAPPTLGYVTSVHDDLVSLPPPKGIIPVAVYNFRDQTGQYKPQPNATSFSTAVTQGATSMLIQSLIESKWFIPLEREGLQDLLTERKITKSSLNQTAQNQVVSLPPLTYAQLLIEGGIIAYETDLVTGGFGAKYFGAGGDIKYRTDRVTVYLRAIDTRTGKVLKSVTTSKSILSRGVDVGLFRFVRLKRLLEVETGLTTNEPPQMCVLEAIEKAVHSLVIEGVMDNLWSLKNPEDRNQEVFTRYEEEKRTFFKPAEHGNINKNTEDVLSTSREKTSET